MGMDVDPLSDLADPREWSFAEPTHPAAAQLLASVAAGLDAATDRVADMRRDDAGRLFATLIAGNGANVLADAFDAAPSQAAARYLWRLLLDAERGDAAATAKLHATPFALPVVLVAATTQSNDATANVPGVLTDRDRLTDLLRSHRAFGGCETLALANVLCGADALDLRKLSAWQARMRIDDSAAPAMMAPLDFAPAPLDIRGGSERVFLRFVAGAVLTPAGFDPLRDTKIAGWGIPFAQAIAQELAFPAGSVLALPRPPDRPGAALQSGRAAQREVSAQLFAANAIRKLRSSVGEPTAVISAHRAADAPNGGELRLSLSSPFALRDAEGFRCPIYPYETARDIAAMLITLLRDCRVGDVRVHAGVHPDVEPTTGVRLLFKTAAPPCEPRH